MDILADHSMHNAKSANPDSDVSSQVTGYRVAPLSNDIRRPKEQAGREEQNRW
jgi:hypothetical protein